MQKSLPAYRVILGYKAIGSRNVKRLIPVVHHVTFYAADENIRNYLMVASGCPSGQVYLADEVHDGVEKPFSAN